MGNLREFIGRRKTKQLIDILCIWTWEHENGLENNKKKITIAKEELLKRGINFNSKYLSCYGGGKLKIKKIKR